MLERTLSPRNLKRYKVISLCLLQRRKTKDSSISSLGTDSRRSRLLCSPYSSVSRSSANFPPRSLFPSSLGVCLQAINFSCLFTTVCKTSKALYIKIEKRYFLSLWFECFSFFFPREKSPPNLRDDFLSAPFSSVESSSLFFSLRSFFFFFFSVFTVL